MLLSRHPRTLPSLSNEKIRTHVNYTCHTLVSEQWSVLVKVHGSWQRINNSSQLQWPLHLSHTGAAAAVDIPLHYFEQCEH